MVLAACGGEQVSTATLASTTTTADTDAAAEESLLGYSPFGCPVWDFAKLYEIDEPLDVAIGLPWCTDLGIVTTYCGIASEDMATRFSEQGEIISGGGTTMDSTHSISTYDTLLPGFPQATIIRVFMESYGTLICPNGETLFITDEHSDIFMGVGKPSDLPPRSALVSPVTTPVTGQEEVTTTVGDVGSTQNSVECPRENWGYIESDQAALCLYQAWVAGDSELASWYATDEAIAWLGPQPDAPPGWHWEGCSETGDPIWLMSCHWFADDGGHGVSIEMLLGGGGNSAGFWVESIESFG